MRLGALSGFFGSLILLFFAVFIYAIVNNPEWRQVIQQSVQQSGQASDPKYQQVLELIRNPQQVSALMSARMIPALFIVVLLSSFGGAIGAAVLRLWRKE